MAGGWDLEARLRDIRLVVSDVDGVLTDGGMYYAENGDELKKFNVRDGVAAALLRRAGIRLGIMTGENIALLQRRMRKIKADFLFAGVSNKLARLQAFLPEHRLGWQHVAFVGDEINDYPLIGHVGVFFAPADAAQAIRRGACCVTTTAGGAGVLREVAELLLTARGQYDQVIADYVASGQSPSAAEIAADGDLHTFNDGWHTS